MAFDWKSVVGTVAPLLGTALGGPFGGVAGKMIQDALGVDSESAAIAELQTNPDALISLRQVEADFKIKMKEIGIAEDQLHADDRDSARKLAIAKGTGFQAGLTVVFMVGYFGLMAVFLMQDATDKALLNDWQRGQVGILVGVLTAAIPQLLSFWFGSSKGSKEKTAIMGEK